MMVVKQSVSLLEPGSLNESSLLNLAKNEKKKSPTSASMSAPRLSLGILNSDDGKDLFKVWILKIY